MSVTDTKTAASTPDADSASASADNDRVGSAVGIMPDKRRSGSR